MIKQLGVYLLSFSLLSLIGYFSHTTIFSELALKSIFPLTKVYLFFGIFSALLCAILLILYRKEKFKDQIGFFYLASVALKIILFCIVFYERTFTEDSFTKLEVINLLIPMALILVLEVFFIRNLLNNIEYKKNVK